MFMKIITLCCNKSFSMCIKPSTIKFTRPWFFLAGMKIPIITHCKYLDVIVSEHSSDNDLKRQMRKFYSNANMLIRKFTKCSVNIKCYLFKTYCSTIYCSGQFHERVPCYQNTISYGIILVF